MGYKTVRLRETELSRLLLHFYVSDRYCRTDQNNFRHYGWVTPEQLLAVAPSVVAIAIAVIGAIMQWRSRVADDRRLTAQREADQERWAKQRSTDESRWRAQLQSEQSKSVSEHERVLELKELERSEEREKEHFERLRSATADFVAVFGEALVATRRMFDEFNNAAAKNEWHQAIHIYAVWRNSDLPVRLSVATAKLRLHGPSVGDPASTAQETLRESIRDMYDRFTKNQDAPWGNTMTEVEDSFRQALEAALRQLDHHREDGDGE